MQNERHQPELSPSSYPFGYEDEVNAGIAASLVIDLTQPQHSTSNWSPQLNPPSQAFQCQELGLQSFDTAEYEIQQLYLPDFNSNTLGAGTTGHAPRLNYNQVGNAPGLSYFQETLQASALNDYQLEFSFDNSGLDAPTTVSSPTWERSGNGARKQLFSTASEYVADDHGLNYTHCLGGNTRWKANENPILATSGNSNWLSGFQNTGTGMNNVLSDFNNPDGYSNQASLAPFMTHQASFVAYQQQLHSFPTSLSAFEAFGYEHEITEFDFNDIENPLSPMSMNSIGQFPAHVNDAISTAARTDSFNTSTLIAIPPATVPQPPVPATALAFACRHPPCVWSFKCEHERNRHENSKHRHVPGAIVCPIQGCPKAVGRGWKRADKVTEHLWKVHGDLGYVKKG